jgi:hypothetical protein
MSDFDRDPDSEPATTEEEQREEGRVLFQGWIRVAAVSILMLVLLGMGLLYVTGIIDVVPF